MASSQDFNFKTYRPDFEQLDDRAIHVWRAELNLPIDKIAGFKNLLSADELARADRLKIPQRCDRFIAGRGILRILLGYYLNQSPQQIEFKYGNRGKPYLNFGQENHSQNSQQRLEASTRRSQNLELYFNLAHSNDLALYAFSYANELGIDLEKVRPMPHADRLAKRFFAESEYTVMQSLPAVDRQEVFFKTWTRKEAYLKAVGVGIVQLKQVELNIAPDLPAKILSIQGDRQIAQRWQLADLAIDPGFAAAIAIESSKLADLDLQYFNFQGASNFDIWTN
ncbi:phosphopantetheine-protein transferase [Thalassoporum mexicanum PCC 7367]|uniref:4'-phosphopantetheinyl transferase family protein n=1 Tax=Thalassoporum mexicanum TaxID=3457544 RepID=UPI00029FA544|nr:4'-phosphopantetheinyl transferase superfamily protein [Pseudanabaena sp. PCC 7367]AFY71226.1 phosphopantetheine-protein transferase [Pseudanabaena sp. PCC 7367]